MTSTPSRTIQGRKPRPPKPEKMSMTALNSPEEGHLDRNGHVSPLADVLQRQKVAFLTEGNPSFKTRVDRIERLAALVANHTDELVDALAADFGTRPRALSLTGDLAPILLDAREATQHLKSWMRVDRPSQFIDKFGIKRRIRHDPLGVAGIAGPWNFPVQLAFGPAVAALAAGNRVMVRPSSVTARTSAVLADAADRYFPPDELYVATAESGPGSEFSKLNFDAFFFTGSPAVGREVAKDCAANLVPVTLELGGKNPVIVDHAADFNLAADRIARAKLVNSGQVCLCPDYVFVPASQVEAFVDAVLKIWAEMFPSIEDNSDYTSIINDSNYRRIINLIDDARAKGATIRQMIPTGEALPAPRTRKIPPTILLGVGSDAQIATDEIFGPALVVHSYTDLAEPIAHLASHELPLAMYWFGPDNARFDEVLNRTRSGSVNGNDFLLNMLPGLPFGGVGMSGMGNYHGKYGFATFTHARAVAHSTLRQSIARSIAPPYSRLSGGIYSVSRLRNRRALKQVGKQSR
ncbi:aldehyde dehydrogenase family protein [Mycobacterium sp. PDNC021]|uniref:aldehyde dehydrogenase family protein n=1 Tax=Mycobacterium sp. PDNC021 TaxID=3391399 RepID=UPI003AAB6457